MKFAAASMSICDARTGMMMQSLGRTSWRNSFARTPAGVSMTTLRVPDGALRVKGTRDPGGVLESGDAVDLREAGRDARSTSGCSNPARRSRRAWWGRAPTRSSTRGSSRWSSCRIPPSGSAKSLVASTVQESPVESRTAESDLHLAACRSRLRCSTSRSALAFLRLRISISLS